MAKHRSQLIEYLGGKCKNCKADVQEIVERYGDVQRMFHFHHIMPDEKADNYSNLIERKISAEQIDEIDKCILLCGNCHNILHAQAHDGAVTFSVEIDGRKATQTLRGSFIADRKENTIQFLTNEKLYLSPYLLKIGNQEGLKFVYGSELYDGIMIECLENIEEIGEFSLLRYSDQSEVFKANHSGSNTIDVSYDIGMELPLALNAAGTDKTLQKGWVRNGVTLLEDGRVLTSGKVRFSMGIPVNNA